MLVFACFLVFFFLLFISVRYLLKKKKRFFQKRWFYQCPNDWKSKEQIVEFTNNFADGHKLYMVKKCLFKRLQKTEMRSKIHRFRS